MKNNGVKRSRFYVLRHSTMPSALVEPGFITNRKDLNKIKNPKFRQKIAESLYKGILRYIDG